MIESQIIDICGKAMTVRTRKAAENEAKNHLFIQQNNSVDWTAMRKKDIFFIDEGNSARININKIKEVIKRNTFVIMCSANILPFLLENDINPHICILDQPYAPKIKFSNTKDINLCAIKTGCHDWIRGWKGGISFFSAVEGFIGESAVGYACVLADYYVVRSIAVIGGEFFWYEADENPYFYKPKVEMEINQGCLSYTYLYNAATFLNLEFGVRTDNPRRLIYIDLSEGYMEQIQKICIEDFVYMLKGDKQIKEDKPVLNGEEKKASRYRR